MNIDIDKVHQNVNASIDALGQVELSGIKLEDAKAELLDINSLSLDLHVAMQPAALAYYGQLRKTAMRRIDDLKNRRERWQKIKYAEAKEACLRDMPKATVSDIEARVVRDNIDEIKQLDEAEFHAQEIFDTLDAWYEAWKQKGYALREHISMEVGERANTATSIGIEDVAPISKTPAFAANGSFNKFSAKHGKD